MSTSPKKSAEEYRERGRELFKNGDFEGAAKVYQEAVEYYRSDTALLNNLSLCYVRLGDWSRARFFAFLCTFIEPKNQKAGY